MKPALVQHAIPGSTGTQDYTDAVFSSDVKGAVLFGSRATANATQTNGGALMLGATDGTTTRSACVSASNNVATTQVSGGNSSNALQVINPNSSAAETATLSSVLSTGIRLNWTAISLTRLINMLILGGSDVEMKTVLGTFTGSAAPETLTVSHGLSGGPPDIIFAFSYLGTARYSHGFYERAGAAYASSSYTNITGQTVSVALGGYVGSNAIIRQVSNTTSEYAVTLGNFTATTFDATATGAVTSDAIVYVCIRVTGGAFKVGVLSTPTSPGDLSTSGIGGTPQVLMMLPTRLTAVNTYDNADGSGQVGVGVAVNNNGTIQQMTAGFSSDDGANPSVEQAYATNDRALVIQDTTGAADVEATLSSWDIDGFTLNFSNVAGNSYLVPYLAFGIASSGPIWPQRQHRRTTLIAM